MIIYKYTLPIADRVDLRVPKGARYLSLVSQYDQPTLYVAVDPEEKIQDNWCFEIRGTGHEVSEGIVRVSQFLGTIVTHKDQLVWHIWRTK